MRLQHDWKGLEEVKSLVNTSFGKKKLDIHVDSTILHLPTGLYKPFLTLDEFHHSEADVKIVIGPFGSGKSSALTCEIIRHATMMPKCNDGIRRARWLIIRNTYDELKSTSLQMWEEWSEDLGFIKTNRQPPVTWKHNFFDKDGEIELEVVFLALNSEIQLRKLGSYNVTAAYLNEARELPRSVLSFVGSRTGRYPSRRILPKDTVFWHGVIADTNPPPMKHWIPDLESNPIIEYKLPDGTTRQIIARIFHQPPALIENENNAYEPNPLAENIENLPGEYDYYFKMLANGKDYVRVYAQGKYGSLREGKSVYEKYNDDLHSVDNIKVTPNIPIIYGVDYGRICPAIVLTQFVAGQLRCIKEICGNHIYIKDMAAEELIPWLQEHAPKHIFNGREAINAYGYDDIAQTEDGRNQLLSLDLDVRAARTNRLEPRLASVNNVLGKLTSAGQAALLISRKGCPMLREGFLGEYKLAEHKTIGGAEYKEVPEKNHPYSDIHDALQYVALNYSNLAMDQRPKVQSNRTKPKTMWI